MSRRRFFVATFLVLLLAGTIRDVTSQRGTGYVGILVGDFHVHPFPGDGVLTPWQLQQEAARRGLDVIAVAGHNNRVGMALAGALGLMADAPIILESQELTTPDFHIVAVGVRNMVDWRLPVAAAVRAIHAQGGVAIAAHPVAVAWKPRDAESLGALDGIEVAHPMAEQTGSSRRELDAFFAQVTAVKPHVAPIGSTDFHTAAPLGLCRTYLLTTDRSATGALTAVRQGQTVAQDQYGRLYGSPEHVAQVRGLLKEQPPPPAVSNLDKLMALGALLALAFLVAGHAAHDQTPPDFRRA
jgi:hypothetical protein